MTIADIAAWDDADGMMTETTDPVEQLEQDTYHFLTMDRNANPDAPGRGLNLPAMLSGVYDSGIEAQARAEVLRDTRAARCVSTLSPVAGTDQKDPEGVQAQLELVIEPDDTTAATGQTANVTITTGT